LVGGLVPGAEFFASKKPAAVFKHGILSRYPVVFAAKTGKGVAGNRVIFLDGYAGRGEYDDGEPGSPLLLSRCADSVSSFRQVHGFFVEQDQDNYLNLKRVLDEKGGTTKRTVRHGSVDEHLAEVLEAAGGAPLFAFLDPFGPALDFTRLKAMLHSRPQWPPTEVLLHFSVLSVARMGGAVRAARERHGKLPEGDRKTAERLSRFLGGDWWQDHFASAGATDERRATDIAMTVCEIYEQKLTAGTAYERGYGS
jgi:three-Cys-motif partner protein